jgi:uncharacterized delta-60 repeat protein
VALDGGTDPDIGLVRYLTSGSRDPDFGEGGIVRRDVSGGNWDEAADLALQPDGKIVVAAQAVVAGKFSFAVVRLEAGGGLDDSFGVGGVATVAFTAQPDIPQAVTLQSDGKILVAGRSSNRVNADFAIARFDPGGRLDPSFGTGGKVTVDFFGADDGAEAVALQGDGKIVLGGFAGNGPTLDFGVARLNP